MNISSDCASFFFVQVLQPLLGKENKR